MFTAGGGGGGGGGPESLLSHRLHPWAGNGLLFLPGVDVVSHTDT